MTQALSCPICSLHRDVSRLGGDEIWRNDRWLLRHHADPAPLVGWCLLDSRRHLGGPIDFVPEEAAEWGHVVMRATQLVKRVSGCDRVYAIAFGEGARHLHLHLIPRHGSDPRTSAWSVADLYRQIEAGDQQPVPRADVARFLATARQLASACLDWP
ncbi:MAG: diadenosine tetraphosphate hydrolase [Synechococcus sp.]|nr:diadenosine tetraphosphate hydrolase [Synechococcus sp.]